MSGKAARARSHAKKRSYGLWCRVITSRGSWYGKTRILSITIRALRLSRRVHRARRNARQLP